MGEEKLFKKIMSIQAFPSIYISIYTLTEMIFQVTSFFESKNTSYEANSYWNSIIQTYYEAKYLHSHWISLSLRSDSFVGKEGQIKVLESMTKFIAALAELYFTVGVLQLISMAGRSSQWFTLLPLCAPYNPLLKRLLLMDSQLHYPCCSSR